MRELRMDEVEFELKCEEEHESIEGFCMASGDEEVDRECADEIRRQLRAGNEWAWCCVVVTARWNGYEGFDSLGCCSYESEEDFKNGGYYDGMKQQALDNLNARIAACLAKCRMLEELLG